METMTVTTDAGPAICRIPSHGMPGVGKATLDVVLNAQEHARRQRHALGAVTDRWTLHVLMGLPGGEPVPLAALRAEERTVLEHMAPGVVEIESGTVRRALLTPTTVSHAYVRRARWQDALAAASHYAPFCRRTIVVRQLPRDPSRLLFEAEMRGVGVAMESDFAMTVIIPAGAWRARRVKPASWVFLEHAYAAFLVWNAAHSHRQGQTCLAHVSH